MELLNSRMHRGNQQQGVGPETSPHPITFHIDSVVGPGGHFRFSLKSKGGGTTIVYLEIGKEDWPRIFQELLSRIPESSEWFNNAVTQVTEP